MLEFFDVAAAPEHGSCLLFNSVAFGVETVWLLPLSDTSGGGVPRRLASQARVVAASQTEVFCCISSPTQPAALVSCSLRALLSAKAPLDETSALWRPIWGGVWGAERPSTRWSQDSLVPKERIRSSNTHGEVIHFIRTIPSKPNGAAVFYPHGGPSHHRWVAVSLAGMP
jgi:hypothetical protein